MFITFQFTAAEAEIIRQAVPEWIAPRIQAGPNLTTMSLAEGDLLWDVSPKGSQVRRAVERGWARFNGQPTDDVEGEHGYCAPCGRELINGEQDGVCRRCAGRLVR